MTWFRYGMEGSHANVRWRVGPRHSMARFRMMTGRCLNVLVLERAELVAELTLGAMHGTRNWLHRVNFATGPKSAGVHCARKGAVPGRFELDGRRWTRRPHPRRSR